ncbi:unnamed protein product [Amoebophrya sp. A25]|nr:unnamed protein product [Amoebophrya sp. A25]|eukprot:GSA25T00014296001.1
MAAGTSLLSFGLGGRNGKTDSAVLQEKTRPDAVLRDDRPRLRKQICQTKRVIVHMDLDCFYVAVERRLNPMLRSKPVGLCQWSQQHASYDNVDWRQDRLLNHGSGVRSANDSRFTAGKSGKGAGATGFDSSKGERNFSKPSIATANKGPGATTAHIGGGAGTFSGGGGFRASGTGHNAGIIALSYEAKACGVKRGMFVQDALRVCPDMLFVGIPTRFGKADTSFYRDAGSEVMEVLNEFGPVERVSIDEAYLDLTSRSAEGFNAWVERRGRDILLQLRVASALLKMEQSNDHENTSRIRSGQQGEVKDHQESHDIMVEEANNPEIKHAEQTDASKAQVESEEAKIRVTSTISGAEIQHGHEEHRNNKACEHEKEAMKGSSPRLDAATDLPKVDLGLEESNVLHPSQSQSQHVSDFGVNLGGELKYLPVETSEMDIELDEEIDNEIARMLENDDSIEVDVDPLPNMRTKANVEQRASGNILQLDTILEGEEDAIEHGPASRKDPLQEDDFPVSNGQYAAASADEMRMRDSLEQRIRSEIAQVALPIALVDREEQKHVLQQLRSELQADLDFFRTKCLPDTDRLTIHGKPFFSDMVYDKADKEAAPGLALLANPDKHLALVASEMEMGMGGAGTGSTNKKNKSEAITEEEKLGRRQHAALFSELFEFYCFVNATRICYVIQVRVWKSLSLSCSLGVGNTKCVSKIASGKHKPFRLSAVFPLGVPEFLSPLQIRDLRGYGAKLGKDICTKLGAQTVGEVLATKLRLLAEKLTATIAAPLADACHGIDDNPVEPRLLSKIVGTSKRWHTPQYLVDENLRGWMQTLLADFAQKAEKEKTEHGRQPLQAVVSWRGAQGNDMSKTIPVAKLTLKYLTNELLKNRDPFFNLGFTAQRWVCLETGATFRDDSGVTVSFPQRPCPPLENFFRLPNVVPSLSNRGQEGNEVAGIGNGGPKNDNKRKKQEEKLSTSRTSVLQAVDSTTLSTSERLALEPPDFKLKSETGAANSERSKSEHLALDVNIPDIEVADLQVRVSDPESASASAVVVHLQEVEGKNNEDVKNGIPPVASRVSAQDDREKMQCANRDENGTESEAKDPISKENDGNDSHKCSEKLNKPFVPASGDPASASKQNARHQLQQRTRSPYFLLESGGMKDDPMIVQEDPERTSNCKEISRQSSTDSIMDAFFEEEIAKSDAALETEIRDQQETEQLRHILAQSAEGEQLQRNVRNQGKAIDRVQGVDKANKKRKSSKSRGGGEGSSSGPSSSTTSLCAYQPSLVSLLQNADVINTRTQDDRPLSQQTLAKDGNSNFISRPTTADHTHTLPSMASASLPSAFSTLTEPKTRKNETKSSAEAPHPKKKQKQNKQPKIADVLARATSNLSSTRVQQDGVIDIDSD